MIVVHVGFSSTSKHCSCLFVFFVFVFWGFVCLLCFGWRVMLGSTGETAGLKSPDSEGPNDSLQHSVQCLHDSITFT